MILSTDFLKSDVDRFMSHVKKNTNVLGCDEWQGALTYDGYGVFKFNGSTLRANRVAYALANHVCPDKLEVCHRCDNRKCVNPEHLKLGTRKYNQSDKSRKGRHYSTRAKKLRDKATSKILRRS